MSRVRQLYPSNYPASGNISAEFENLIRYLNSAELGNRTIGELMRTLFNDEGEFDGPIEFRKDSSHGLQYRVGEYASPEKGWTDLIALDEIRGEPGQNVGLVALPVQHSRADYVATAGQTVFNYVHLPSDQLLVYKNGVLQRPGSLASYTSNPAGASVTFVTGLAANDLVTIIRVEQAGADTVPGIMLEGRFTDPATGLLRYDKLGIADNAIPQSKVSGLAQAIQRKANLTTAATAPAIPVVGDLWLDTTQTPNQLKCFDGVRWIIINDESTLPPFTVNQAGQFLRVNSTGSGFVWGEPDVTGLLPKSFRGAANGVASLGADGFVPLNQVPEQPLSISPNFYQAGGIANGTYRMQGMYRQKVLLLGLAAQLSSGSCTIQLAVNGTGIGQSFGVTVSGMKQNFASPIEIDATTVMKTLGVIVTDAVSPANLEVVVGAQLRRYL